MKIKNLGVLALIGLFSATTLAGPLTADAETDPVSKGKVTIKDGEGGGSDSKTVDPEDSGNTLPDDDEINKNEDKGSLIIEAVSNLDFGTLRIDGKEVTQYAKEVEATDKTTGAFVQWADLRGSESGYTIKGAMTTQFTSENADVLEGATITYNYGDIIAENENSATKPTYSGDNKVLSQGGDAQVFASADEATAGQGKGRWVMEFGKSARKAPDDPTSGKAVALTIPAKTASAMKNGNYEAAITWTIETSQAAAPAAPGEEGTH